MNYTLAILLLIWVEVFRPQHEHGYDADVDEWDAECAKWKAGARPDDLLPGESEMTYEQFAGQRPHRDDYMPDWPDEQRGHSDQPCVFDNGRACAMVGGQRR